MHAVPSIRKKCAGIMSHQQHGASSRHIADIARARALERANRAKVRRMADTRRRGHAGDARRDRCWRRTEELDDGRDRRPRRARGFARGREDTVPEYTLVPVI